jgi:hypothetical protein
MNFAKPRGVRRCAERLSRWIEKPCLVQVLETQQTTSSFNLTPLEHFNFGADRIRSFCEE